MLDRIFSSVLLPEPLRPTMPKNSPLADLERDAAQRVQLAPLVAREGMEHALLERVDAVLRDPEGLLDAADVDDHRCVGGGHRSRRVRAGQTRARQRRSRRCSKASRPGRLASHGRRPGARARGEERDEPAPDDAAHQLALAAQRLRPTREHAQRPQREPCERRRRPLGGDEPLQRAALARRHRRAAAGEQHRAPARRARGSRGSRRPGRRGAARARPRPAASPCVTSPKNAPRCCT